MAKRVFHFEFEDESATETGRKHDGITYEYSLAEDEHLRCTIIDGAPFISGNSTGLIMLAKILVKISMSKYRDGFHVHLRKDFNADLPEILTIGISTET